MQQDNTFISLIPHKDIEIEDLKFLNPLVPFDDTVLDLLNSLSKELLRISKVKSFPDIVTFAFWCRKTNILRYKKQYQQNNGMPRFGRGVVFHIAPSNVPINFAYSLVMGLLAGNCNIVRVPSKDYYQTDAIVLAFKNIFDSNQFAHLKNYVHLIKYTRNVAITEQISKLCDVRVIWGGDQTISEIRKSPIPSRAFDITFADRYSLCLIHADALVNEENISALVQKFYNDTYMFDQNACTSPHLVLWYGEKDSIIDAKKVFWNALQELVNKAYTITPVQAVDKYMNFCRQAIHFGEVRGEKASNNLLYRSEIISQLTPDVEQYRCACGYFTEHNLESLESISSFVTRKYQTLSYYGFDKSELKRMLEKIKPLGIDRIVPIGSTLDFDLIWDGYDLMTSLSRIVTVR